MPLPIASERAGSMRALLYSQLTAMIYLSFDNLTAATRLLVELAAARRRTVATDIVAAGNGSVYGPHALYTLLTQYTKESTLLLPPLCLLVFY